MSYNLESRTREAIYANWTDEATVAAWRRWHDKISQQQRSISDALIEAAGIGPGMRVLELAGGSGEPGLQIARTVGPEGRVVLTDISEGMLQLARANAAAQNLTNVDFDRADAETLPYADARFDAVTSRMGAMFFVDMEKALREIRAVLKENGRVAFAVWGLGSETTIVKAIVEPFFRRANPDPPKEDAPHPQRYNAPGKLANCLEKAGFREVREQRLVLPTPWHGTPEELWQMYYDIAAPAYFDTMPEADRRDAFNEAASNVRKLQRDGFLEMNSSVVIVDGTR